jgi:DNA polymerase V
MIAQTYTPVKSKKNTLQQKRSNETGFPSPATDHLENRLNLNDRLVKYPASTFFIEVGSDSEEGLGVSAGDILIVDRSLAPRSNSLVIAEMEGEHVVCRAVRTHSGWKLEKGNGDMESLDYQSGQGPQIWGRVTHVIHSV